MSSMIESVDPRDRSTALAIRALLQQADLPVPGLTDAPVSFLVARAGTAGKPGQAAAAKEIIGCVGWESYGTRALLRSQAVRADARGGGVGRALTETLCARLAAAGMTEVYLLTTDAAGFFAKLGFTRIERGQVPESVLQSREFTMTCCASAVVMRRGLTD